MKNFWDERFVREDYVYGLEPNSYIKSKLDVLEPGILFLPCEGEGRNAVYAAGKGWTVHALDSSKEGKRKALSLANERKLDINYKLGDCLSEEFPKVDATALCFGHFEEDDRKTFHHNLIKSLNPGGHLILECFAKDQLGRSSGGPKKLELLYDLEMLRNDFSELEILELEQKEVVLDEGPFHQGKAITLRLFAQKL